MLLERSRKDIPLQQASNSHVSILVEIESRVIARYGGDQVRLGTTKVILINPLRWYTKRGNVPKINELVTEVTVSGGCGDSVGRVVGRTG